MLMLCLYKYFMSTFVEWLKENFPLCIAMSYYRVFTMSLRDIGQIKLACVLRVYSPKMQFSYTRCAYKKWAYLILSQLISAKSKMSHFSGSFMLLFSRIHWFRNFYKKWKKREKFPYFLEVLKFIEDSLTQVIVPII